MEQLIAQLDLLMEKLPEDVRKIVINKYTDGGEPQSKNVANAMETIKKMDDTELKELKIFISSYMRNGGTDSKQQQQ